MPRLELFGPLAVRGSLQRLRSPLIQAYAAGLGGDQGRAVYLGADSQHQFSTGALDDYDQDLPF